MTQADLFVPPFPAPPAAPLRFLAMARAMRRNALQAWSSRAYDEALLEGRFFGRPRLLLNSPAAIRRVLMENTENYRRTPATLRILGPIIGRGLFLSEGEAWRHQRRTLAPAFAPRTLPLLARHVVAAAAEAVEGLAAAPQPVDLLAVMQRLALDIAGRSMFSLEMSRHGAVLRERLTRYGARLARPYPLDLVLPPGVPTLRDLARRRFGRGWMRLIEQVIAERLALPADAAPRDLLDLLLAARDPETGAAFTPLELRDQVATLLVAGHETTAVTLFWACYLLASAPQAQERAAAEAAGAPAADSPDALPWIRAVVGETLRLYPPAYLMVRQAIGPDQVDGAAVAPGTLMMIAPWVLHRHRRLWPAPNAFDPERFMPGAPAVDRFAYLPFGIGPRVCIGAQFAMTEATLVLAALLRRFRVALADGRPVLPQAVITTQPDHPPPFRLIARA
jgi:unspecific monooxygenase